MSNALTLYQIASDFREAAALLADTEADEQAVADTLEGLHGALQVKGINVAMLVQNLAALAASIKAAEQAMAARRTAIEHRAERIRGYLKACMELASVTEISSPYFRIALKRNPPSVIIDDEVDLPAIFLVPQPPVVDKRAIGEALKAGADVPGAHFETKTRLEIR